MLHEQGRQRPGEAVGGFLSAFAIFAGAISIAWHPLRLSLLAMLLAVVGAAMAPRGNALARAAVMIAALCFFLGMAVAVVTSRPLW